MKFPWWRGVRGQLIIEGRRVDAQASPLRAHIPEGYGETGFQSTLLIFPTDGCWEVTGKAGEASLTFVTLVVKEVTAKPTVLIYPQLALGGGFEVVLIVSNKGTETWSGRGILREKNQKAWSSSWSLNGTERVGASEFQIALPPKATRKFVLSSASGARAGYLEIMLDADSSTSDVMSSFFYNFYTGDKLVDSTGVNAATPGNSFSFPVERSASVNTGFAIAPFLVDFPISVTYVLSDQNGNEVRRKTALVEGHKAQFFDELFEDVPSSFLGFVSIEAQSPLTVTVLRLESTDSGFQLTSIPSAQ